MRYEKSATASCNALEGRVATGAWRRRSTPEAPTREPLSPEPLKVETTVTQLQSIRYLRVEHPGWFGAANVVDVGSRVLGHVLPLGPEVAGIIDMAGYTAALHARMEGKRFVTVLRP